GGEPEVEVRASARRSQARGEGPVTPSAVTPAGRAATKKRAASSERPGARTGAALQAPRPARQAPRAASQGSGTRASAPRENQRAGIQGPRRGISQRAAPKAPRRVSGPVRGRLADAIAPKPAPARTRRTTAPVGVRAAAFVRALPDHPLLDRLIRGRIWIP